MFQDSDKPIILVTNDDGITAPGIAALANKMKQYGQVIVVAPDSPQSAMGHAITISKPLRLDQVNVFPDIPSFQCSGTPVDCVKLAVNQILHRKPDLIVSGVNHGSNSSINVIYSGTISAALEGAIEGIPSVGFSLLNYAMDADFEPAAHYAGEVVEMIMSQAEWPKGFTLNVNIPNLKKDEIKGIKICRQAMGYWVEEFNERKDPTNRSYYWMTGKFINPDHGEDTDEWALKHGYVSVVPITYDFTAHHAIGFLNTLPF